MYSDFALVYDRLMHDVDYDAWAAHYRALLSLNGVKEGALVMEAACGTGSLTLRLAKRYQVLPSDASADMLSVAAGKAKAAGLRLTFLQQDMVRLSSHKKADALVCACDGVNYLLSKTALSSFFSSAFEVLKPGGVLAFDISTVDKLKRVLCSAPQVFRAEDVSYIWENAWQEKEKKLRLSLSVFTRQKDGAYLRIDEEQVQRGWEEEELLLALKKSGFTGIKFYGNFTLTKPRENAQRLHVTAIKPMKESIKHA